MANPICIWIKEFMAPVSSLNRKLLIVNALEFRLLINDALDLLRCSLER